MKGSSWEQGEACQPQAPSLARLVLAEPHNPSATAGAALQQMTHLVVSRGISGTECMPLQRPQIGSLMPLHDQGAVSWSTCLHKPDSTLLQAQRSLPLLSPWHVRSALL